MVILLLTPYCSLFWACKLEKQTDTSNANTKIGNLVKMLSSLAILHIFSHEVNCNWLTIHFLCPGVFGGWELVVAMGYFSAQNCPFRCRFIESPAVLLCRGNFEKNDELYPNSRVNLDAICTCGQNANKAS